MPLFWLWLWPDGANKSEGWGRILMIVEHSLPFISVTIIQLTSDITMV